MSRAVVRGARSPPRRSAGRAARLAPPSGEPGRRPAARCARDHEAIRRPRRRANHRLRHPRGLDREPHRPQRGGQDDLLQRHRRPARADRRHDLVRREPVVAASRADLGRAVLLVRAPASCSASSRPATIAAAPRGRRRAAVLVAIGLLDRVAGDRDHPAAVVRAPPAAGRDLPQRAAQRDGRASGSAGRSRTSGCSRTCPRSRTCWWGCTAAWTPRRSTPRSGSPRHNREEAAAIEQGPRVARLRRAQGPRRGGGPQPPVRRPAAARDRPGARQQAQAAPARRADGRHEPRRDAPDDRPDQPGPRATSGSPSCSSSTTCGS